MSTSPKSKLRSKTSMKAFNNSPAVKEQYLALASRSRRSHSDRARRINGDNNSTHYPAEIGLPPWLSRLEDQIFITLPGGEAWRWPEQLLAAVPVGADESEFAVLSDRFQIFWLFRQLSQMDVAKFPGVASAIHSVIGLLRRAASGDEPGNAEWSAANSAANSAAMAIKPSGTWLSPRPSSRPAPDHIKSLLKKGLHLGTG